MSSARSFLHLGLLLAMGALLAAPAHAASSASITVSAVVLSKSNCKFSSATGPTIDFGLIDPSTTGTLVKTATTSITCNGSATNASFAVSAGNGFYHSGTSRRMRHGSTITEFIPYSLSFSPASATVAKGVATNITIQATITPSAFQDAMAGSYSDTVTITVSP